MRAGVGWCLAGVVVDRAGEASECTARTAAGGSVSPGQRRVFIDATRCQYTPAPSSIKHTCDSLISAHTRLTRRASPQKGTSSCILAPPRNTHPSDSCIAQLRRFASTPSPPPHRLSIQVELIAATNPATRILATLSAMEALLSLAFDNIASKDTQKIRKGLRQIEGMLAQICLSGTKSKPSTPGHRRNASAITLSEQQQQQQQQQATAKKLGQLSDDLAFREFFRLQEGFEWNGASSQQINNGQDANSVKL